MINIFVTLPTSVQDVTPPIRALEPLRYFPLERDISLPLNRWSIHSSDVRVSAR
jgi:hypothetical protein